MSSCEEVTLEEVARLADEVYRACQQAEDNRENLADLSPRVFALHHSLYTLRDDVLRDPNFVAHLQAINKTLKKADIFVQSEQRGFETQSKLKRRLRALFSSKTQVERIIELRDDLQARLHQLTAFSMQSCQGQLNQLADKFSEMQSNFYGHQHEFREELLQRFEEQARKLEAVLQNLPEVDRDRNVSSIVHESVDHVDGVLHQHQYLSNDIVTQTLGSGTTTDDAASLNSKSAWKQRGIHVISRNHLVLGDRIGSGSYGEVFKAQWFHEQCAVKKLPTGMMDFRKKNRVMAEARLHNFLRNPNLVEMKGVSLPNGDHSNPWIVMELMDMGLDTFLHEMYDKVSPVALLDIGLQLSSAMETLHRLYNVLHRDLKTANVLMKRDARCEFGWRAKLSDFGMSEARETVSASVQYSGNTIDENQGTVVPVGTPTTMAPEVMLGKPYRHSSDMYSLGVVLFEIVTGEVAWEEVNGKEELRVAVIHERQRPAFPIQNPWSGVDDAVWTEVCALISRCWAHDPMERPSFAHVSGTLGELARRAKTVEVVDDSSDGGDRDRTLCAIEVLEGVRSAVCKLREGSPAEKADAANRIMVLARDQNKRPIITAAGAIEPLVTLLHSGTDKAKENAAGALFGLAWNTENIVSIAAAGAIEPLVTLLHSGTDKAKENAAGALFGLAWNTENMVSIAAAGAIEPLVTLLRSGTVKTKENAAGALFNMAVNTENMVSIAAAGAIEPLVTLLRSGTEKAKEKVAGALFNMAVNTENMISIAAAGAIEPLVALLRSGTDIAKENAAGTLFNLSLNSSIRKKICECGGVEPLQWLRSNGNAEQRRLATKVLDRLE